MCPSPPSRRRRRRARLAGEDYARADATSARIGLRCGAAPPSSPSRSATRAATVAASSVPRAWISLMIGVPNTRPLAKRSALGARADCHLLDVLHAGVREPRLLQQRSHRRRVRVAERRVEEGRGVRREQQCERLDGHAGEGVVQERSARLQHALGLAHRERLVGEEHHVELAHQRVERGVGEGQRLRVRGPPRQAGVVPDMGPPNPKHRLADIGGDEVRVSRHPVQQRAGDHAGARGGLQDAHPARDRQALAEVERVGREDRAPEASVVGLRDRIAELFRAAHDAPRFQLTTR